ncbi:CoA:oxalate CoA-transferase [Bradyrhizobium sp. AZCC 1678]|uniref:CaiB/BaiF CoA transferase family protein n=1 Tax=Bradyrhizobium sp. AZCC 1678 TaxID=3117030 RepID=UPI002FF13D13
MSSELRSSLGPLAGLKVLDLTQFLSGPYATQILGDLGAEVVKVEPPEGDMTRQLPPYFVGADSAYYHCVNRNKRSLAVDLKSEEGSALVRDLAVASDVVVENFRPGVLDRLGLRYADIAANKRSLVWCSISGFGQSGPYRDRPAYDMIVQAMSGGMSLTGEADGHPVRSGIPLGDLAAGMYGVIGLLAALLDARRTGHGRHVDIAMLDCQISMLSYQGAYHLVSGHVPGRQGRGHDSIPTYRAFTCGDGADVVITANTERMWQSLCGVLRRSDLAGDERFVVNEIRFRNRIELWAVIEPIFLTRSSVEWVEALRAAEIPAAVVNTLDRSLSDDQVLYRNMVLDLSSPDQRLRVPGNPVKYVGESEIAHRFPPGLGTDEDEVLSTLLGFSAEKIGTLRRTGIIGPRRDRTERPASAGSRGVAK